MSEKENFHKRSFLNADRGMAAFEATISSHSWENSDTGKKHVSIDCSLTLSDCSRMVTLDFSVSDEESLEKALRKFSRLLHAVEDTRDALLKTAKREGLKHR